MKIPTRPQLMAPTTTKIKAMLPKGDILFICFFSKIKNFLELDLYRLLRGYRFLSIVYHFYIYLDKSIDFGFKVCYFLLNSIVKEGAMITGIVLFTVLIVALLFKKNILRWFGFLKDKNIPDPEELIKDIKELSTNGFSVEALEKIFLRTAPGLKFVDQRYYKSFWPIIKLLVGFFAAGQKGFFGNAGSFFEGVKKSGTFVVTDDQDNPFQLTEQIFSTTHQIIKDANTEEEKARALFKWFEDNAAYGEAKRQGVGYRNSAEVADSAEGVCGELAILYIVMARTAGLKANYVHVDTDYKGEQVNHACAGVYIDNKFTLVDPAYQRFDVAHKVFVVISDADMLQRFKNYRRS